MHFSDRTKLSIVTGTCAVALAAAGCSNGRHDDDTRGAAGTTGTVKGQSVSLSGCLQRGGGITDKFILTQVNGTEGTTAGANASTGAAPSSTAANAPSNPNANPNAAPNANPAPTGTAGSASADIVGREQHAMATKTYRVDGDDDQLRDLVGKQVRLDGHITDTGDLGSASKPDTTAGGNVDRDVRVSDLARVKVDSISKVADSCGAASNPQQ